MHRILLADDSRPIRRVVELTLENGDVELRLAESGSQALEIVDGGFEPDLALVDVHMPHVSGLELCRSLRDRFPAIQVLLLVGTFEPFDAAEGEAAGAVGHLLKPFSVEDLRQRIDDMLGEAVDAPASAEGEGRTDEEEPVPPGPDSEGVAVAPLAPSMLTGQAPAEASEEATASKSQGGDAGETTLSEADLDALARKVASYLLDSLSAASAEELFVRVAGDEVRRRIDQLEKELAVGDEGD